tara:strand:+ start:5348 stop:5599 length:252 start_codon:yes stop_codon:yes gene_type:complete
MRIVSIGRPPMGDEDQLEEWLDRLVISINSAIQVNGNFEIAKSLPAKIEEGMVLFFDKIILPEITYTGPWVVVDGVWKPLTPP